MHSSSQLSLITRVPIRLKANKSLGANGRNLAARNRKAADEFASLLRAKLDADLMQRSYSEIARRLNDAGITTVTGRKFYPQTAKNYVIRLKPLHDPGTPRTRLRSDGTADASG